MHDMDAIAYRAQLVRLGLSQASASRLLGINDRTSRRYALNERAIPSCIERLLWVCEQHPELIPALSDRTRWPDNAAEPD